MQIVTVLGVLFFVIALVLGVIAIVQWMLGRALEGFTTVIIITLLAGSIIMTSMGIIGYYIAKMYEELKGRPKYIVTQTENTQDVQN